MHAVGFKSRSAARLKDEYLCENVNLTEECAMCNLCSLLY
jgi:hypothetical protein